MHIPGHHHLVYNHVRYCNDFHFQFALIHKTAGRSMPAHAVNFLPVHFISLIIHAVTYSTIY
jgi:hypothetical protein